jgi:beta-lactamase regulating signal transducer with metallopeptidase domain
MRELGLTMAWSAVQITLILLPAAALHLLASRRSAASGSWMAVVGLSLSVALSAAAFVPRPRNWHSGPLRARAGTASTSHPVVTSAGSRMSTSPTGEQRPPSDRLSPSLGGLQPLWSRLQLGANAPPEHVRRWGSALAIAGIVVAGVGLARLLIGAWAVRVCRRRGTIVDDSALTALVGEIRVALGYSRAVEVRALSGLTTPATAGWRWPVILLPHDWRSWHDADRRAVLAHELAHIARGDYAAGLVAQLALALHFYHPLVHWLAGRLHWQQELAADAVGARIAGGRESYLHTLAKLALKQEERSPCWPARAFLPARGTLIRRIAMLQDSKVTPDRPWSRPRRLLATLGLLVLAVIVALVRGPARAGEDETRPDTSAGRVASPHPGRDATAPPAPFDLRFVSGTTPGVIAFRPAATFRHRGLASAARLIDEQNLGACARLLHVDLSRPDRLQLGIENIESVVMSLNFDQRGEDEHGAKTQRIMVGAPVTVRTTSPFDWSRFLRQWGCELHDVRDDDRVYYKLEGEAPRQVGPDPCVYLPDDRTAVFSDERTMRVLIRPETRVISAHLIGPEWERVSRGLLAMALQNADGAFARDVDLGRPDDAVVLTLFKGVDHWVFGIDDAESIVLRAVAACQEDASVSLASAVDAVIKMGRAAIEREQPGAKSDDAEDLALRLARALMANLRVERDDRSVTLRADRFGTLTDIGAWVDAEFNPEAGLKRDREAQSK